jgi:hypothetical protein
LGECSLPSNSCIAFAYFLCSTISLDTRDLIYTLNDFGLLVVRMPLNGPCSCGVRGTLEKINIIYLESSFF